MTKIALVVSGLFITTIASAAGVTPLEIDQARANNTLQQAWITGASAPTKTIYEGYVGPTGGCDAGTNSIFTTQASTFTAPATATATTPGSLGNFVAYACKRSGVVSVLYQTVDGGSLNAYTPHTNGTVLGRVAFPWNGASRCSATVFSYVDGTNANNNADVYKGCFQAGANVALDASDVQTAANRTANATALATDANGPQIPVGGFSDVEAALFPASIGGGSVSSFGAQNPAGVTQMFGVAVSIPLYRAMQVQQFPTLYADVTAAAAADPNFSPDLAPNISSAQYTSYVANGGAYFVPDGFTKLVGTTAGTGKRVAIQRRVNTSGTQASSNAFFLNNPCAAGAGGSLPSAAAISTSTLGMIYNASSGNVKTALNTASNLTNANNFAMGVLSLENDWRNDSTPGYRYLKLDGVHPETGDTANARKTAVNGDYKFVMELVNFVRNDNVSSVNPLGLPKTAFESTIVQNITTALANPLAATCPTFPRGLALVPKASNNLCAVGAETMKGTKSANNCAPQVLRF